MKFVVSTQLAYFLSDKQSRQNVRALLKFFIALILIINVFAVTFHVLMLNVEGQEHSWIAGYYWTIVTMTTLGFGDIVFVTDAGRFFSIVVLLSGVILLLVLMPYAFIRYFYAPWLEAQIRSRAPRSLPDRVRDHVLIAKYDMITPVLIKRLKRESIPYFVIEPDPVKAGEMLSEGVAVVSGEIDARETFEALGAERARLVLANREDTTNTNITLTVREVAPKVPVIAIAGSNDSVDVLELAGADHVLPLKRWLGEQLANRVNAQHAQTHVIGRFENMDVAEVPLHHTPLVGKSIRETRLRQVTGVTVIGVWERGRIVPARPDHVLSESSVPLVIGTEDQLTELDALLVIYDVNPNPVVVIGGGTVGRSVSRALREKKVPVHVVEREARLAHQIQPYCDRAFFGDASDRALLMEAGIEEAPSVVLTTNDDAMNIYLASYCRRLNTELRVVSRITHERNIEAIHRAGADFVLSYASLGAEAVFSVVMGRELMVLGEGIDIFSLPVPRSLYGKSLADSQIGARTGLNVVALREKDGKLVTGLTADTVLHASERLMVFGDMQQRKEFEEHFGK
jgi:voltage-gated potassium channel